MSSVSAEEKKRILRERRQAKMAKGKATDRLNDILSSGSSVKENSAVSVLDKPEQDSSVTSGSAPSTATATSSDIHEIHADPEIQDISTIEEIRAIPTQNEDIEQIFQNMFAGAAQRPTDAGDQDQFSQMLMNMLGGAGPETGGASPFGVAPGGAPNANPFAINPEQIQYEADLAAYDAYQQKRWNYRFLVIRYVAILTNFFYHFVTTSSFQASSHPYIRDLATQPTRFATYFITIEVAILSSFYLVSLQNNLLQGISDKSIIIKGLNFGSMFLPQLAGYKSLISKILGYNLILRMFLGDLSLVIVLFGLLSIFS